MSFEAVFATFGGSANIWLENEYWVVLVRPKQVTLGASVVMPKRSLLSIGELSDEELLAFGSACKKLEERLQSRFAFEKINYLMLAMKDPLLHFHVIPRYSQPREFAGRVWADVAWPKAPDMAAFFDDAAIVAAVHERLTSN